jgi:predicted ATP-dependent serine protease
VSLDEAEHQRIFEDEIVSLLFADAAPVVTPAVVLMGGQPGSGKSGLLDVADE